MDTKKKFLVTAGSTAMPIDQVRCISNIFKGRTGTAIALYLAERGHGVTLITSDNQVFQHEGVNFAMYFNNKKASNKVINFRTFDDLERAMKEEITTGAYDVVIHSAAVSDYRVEGVYDSLSNQPALDNNKKISSSHSDLYLHLVPTPKIIDLIRQPWGFTGYLVKFKLQVGISDEELLEIAERSRQDSQADLIVANCLEWSKERAYLITGDKTENIRRTSLPEAIHRKIMEG